jgi:hypothetical protein
MLTLRILTRGRYSDQESKALSGEMDEKVFRIERAPAFCTARSFARNEFAVMLKKTNVVAQTRFPRIFAHRHRNSGP